jgi:hypothetical protein
VTGVTGESKNPHHPIIEGDGHFTRGKCSSCQWSFNGHVDEVLSAYSAYHQEDRLVEPLPTPIEIPKSTGDPFLDAVEKRLIRLVAGAITYEHPTARYVARGLAEARSIHLGEDLGNAIEYVADLTAKLAHLSNRQRAKLVRDGMSRDQMQTIIEDTAR